MRSEKTSKASKDTMISMAGLWSVLDDMKLGVSPGDESRTRKADKIARRSARLRILMYKLRKMNDWSDSLTARVRDARFDVQTVLQ